ncbi:MAG: hypothetical protein ACXVA9_09825, partial [Bdellovibrionales bacterium]
MSLAVAESLARFAFHARLAVDWLAMLKIFGISIFSAGFGMIALSAYSRRRTSLSQLIAD